MLQRNNYKKEQKNTLNNNQLMRQKQHPLNRKWRKRYSKKKSLTI